MLPRDILFVISNYTWGSKNYWKEKFNEGVHVCVSLQLRKQRIITRCSMVLNITLSETEVEYNLKKFKRHTLPEMFYVPPTDLNHKFIYTECDHALSERRYQYKKEMYE